MVPVDIPGIGGNLGMGGSLANPGVVPGANPGVMPDAALQGPSTILVVK